MSGYLGPAENGFPRAVYRTAQCKSSCLEPATAGIGVVLYQTWLHARAHVAASVMSSSASERWTPLLKYPLETGSISSADSAPFNGSTTAEYYREVSSRSTSGVSIPWGPKHVISSSDSDGLDPSLYEAITTDRTNFFANAYESVCVAHHAHSPFARYNMEHPHLTTYLLYGSIIFLVSAAVATVLRIAARGKTNPFAVPGAGCLRPRAD